MDSFHKNLKFASFDVIYNIYNPHISNYIIEIIFVIIEVVQNLSMTICERVIILFYKIIK